MFPPLTRGAVPLLVNGETATFEIDKPVLQIIGLKRLAGNMQDRFRAMLSDGINSMAHVMLTTQLSALVADGEIDTNAIIRVDRCMSNNVQGNKRVLVVLELTVLKKGSELQGRIGDPQLVEPGEEKPAAAAPNANRGGNADVEKPESVSTSSFYGKPAGAANVTSQNRYGGPPSSTASSGSMANSLANSGSLSKTQRTCPIASLNPFQTRWTVLARVASKSGIREWSNQRGTGTLFSCNFVDESGEIRATAFSREVDAFYEHLVEGKLYYISRASLKPANKRFTSVAHDYEMTLNSDTQIERADEEELAASGKKVTIPTAKFNFCKLSELIGEHGVDSLVDVVGVVHNHQPVQEITARSTGKVSSKRELQIVDDSNTQVAVTLWGKDAVEFDQYLDLDGGHPVLVLKGGRITEFQQKVQVGALQSSSLLVNPANVQEVANLRNWYDYEGGSSQSFVPLINSGGATNTGATFVELTAANVRNPDARWRLLKDVNANSASGNDAYFFTKAVVHSALKKDCVYRACPTPGCQKKLIDEHNGQYRCDKCQKTTTDFTHRYMFSAQVADATGSAYVTFFNDTAQTLVGRSADEVAALRDTDPDLYDEVFTSLYSKEFIFKLRAKMDNYNDEQRLRLAGIQVLPLSDADYVVHLMNDIKKWTVK